VEPAIRVFRMPSEARGAAERNIALVTSAATLSQVGPIPAAPSFLMLLPGLGATGLSAAGLLLQARAGISPCTIAFVVRHAIAYLVHSTIEQNA
jgi:hypothetical protein